MTDKTLGDVLEQAIALVRQGQPQKAIEVLERLRARVHEETGPGPSGLELDIPPQEQPVTIPRFELEVARGRDVELRIEDGWQADPKWIEGLQNRMAREFVRCPIPSQEMFRAIIEDELRDAVKRGDLWRTS
jgi:hypothetical protein